MRNMKGILMVGFLAAILFVGCGTRDSSEMIKEHKARDMYKEGAWEERYSEWSGDVDEGVEIFTLSVNVNKNMSEDDMLEVLDYVKLCLHSEQDDTGAYVGDRDSDWICYAVFYRGDSDEELKRFKHVNGESVHITEEDQAKFAGPELRSEEKYVEP